MKIVYLSVGALSLALGIVGIFLPLLPTTPFVLLAAICFSKGSPRLHSWLLNHPVAGPVISDWETNRVIPLKAKILATIMLVPTVIMAAFFSHWPWFANLALASIVIGVLLFIWTKKSR